MNYSAITIGDVLDIITDHGIMNVRNLGRATCEEVVRLLYEKGIHFDFKNTYPPLTTGRVIFRDNDGQIVACYDFDCSKEKGA